MSVCLGTGGGSDLACRSIRMGEGLPKSAINLYVSRESDKTTQLRGALRNCIHANFTLLQIRLAAAKEETNKSGPGHI